MAQIAWHCAALQGPLASIWVEKVSLGRARGLRKAAGAVVRAWDARRIQLPLAVSGVVVQLRAVSHSAAPKRPARASKARAERRRPRLPPQVLAGVRAWLAAAGLRLLAALLPALPLRLRRLTVVCEVRQEPKPNPSRLRMGRCLCKGSKYPLRGHPCMNRGGLRAACQDQAECCRCRKAPPISC